MPIRRCGNAYEAYDAGMELRHLTYFAKVAQLRSVSKAATVLQMTQPSLSRQIMELERELGFRLFDRSSRGVMLTAAGTGLYRHLDAVFAQIERIPEVVRIAAKNREMIRIGVPQGLPHGWFLSLLDTVETRIPSVAVSLHEATTDEQRQLLQNGLIDLALIHLEAPEANYVLLLEQEMGIAVTAGSPLAGYSEIDFAQLDGLTVMAHAVGEIAAEESRLRAAAEKVGVNTQWTFRKFSEHSELIAITAKVDAVLLTEASAGRHLPQWKWIPVRVTDEQRLDLAIRTWAAWNEPASTKLQAIVALMKSTP